MSTHRCPNCGRSVPFERSDWIDEQAECPDCGHSLESSEALADLVDDAGLPGFRSKEELSPSDYERIEVDRSERGLRIMVAWYRWHFIIAFMMGVLWFLLGLVPAGLALFVDGHPWARLGFGAVGLAMIGSSVGLGYYGLAIILNSTVIRLRDGRLSVDAEPLPSWGDVRLDIDAIDDVYCDHHERGASTSIGTGDGTGYNHSVHVRTEGGESREIVSKLPDEVDALGIEKEIEEWLGLSERPTPGDVETW